MSCKILQLERRLLLAYRPADVREKAPRREAAMPFTGLHAFSTALDFGVNSPRDRTSLSGLVNPSVGFRENVKPRLSP